MELQCRVCLEIVLSVRLLTIYAKKRLASEHYGRAMAILELLMIKCGVCWTYQDCHFIVHDIDVMVDIFVLRNYVAL